MSFLINSFRFIVGTISCTAAEYLIPGAGAIHVKSPCIKAEFLIPGGGAFTTSNQ